MRRQGLLFSLLLAACGSLVGCSSNDGGPPRVIGKGPTSLTFVNRGGDDVDVRVTWARGDGGLRTKSFDLQHGGTVELRLVERVEYEVALDAECSCPAAPSTPAVPQHDVVVVGGD
ncbi:MAG: hypothetical protein FJX75_05830 [Armatimonadetes bacterium]|nr:hypothetical protein [Armatimonadota bacterium]